MNLILLSSGGFPLLVQPRERKRYISHINKRNIGGELLKYYKYMLDLLDKSMNMYIKMFVVTEQEAESPLMTIGEFAKY